MFESEDYAPAGYASGREKIGGMGNKNPAEVCDGVAPAQQLESFVMLGRARIWPEAERTLAFAHGLGERGKSAMVVGIATCHSRSRSSSRGREPTLAVM
jgi:hypothetical protein